jgi:hypothetical protein
MKKRRKIHNVPGRVTSTAKTVVLEIDTGGAILELHFGDPAQLMNLFLLAIEEMAKVFPDFEASKLWVDDSFT